MKNALHALLIHKGPAIIGMYCPTTPGVLWTHNRTTGKTEWLHPLFTLES